MTALFDPDLLERLELIGGSPLQTEAWRVAWQDRNPLLGGAGGRWATPEQPRVLYCSQDADGALAEVYYHLSRAPVFSSAEKTLHTLNCNCENALDLTSTDVLAGLGVTHQELTARDMAVTQAIGAAAHFLEYDALRVPSMRWDCANLIVFEDRMESTVMLEVTKSQQINFVAWREQPRIAARLQRR